MKTTLNLPDTVVQDAKRRALAEDTTLTDLIVQGLKARLKLGTTRGTLPVSAATGGLCPGVRWDRLGTADDSGEAYR
jgi:hypothetical protein